MLLFFGASRKNRNQRDGSGAFIEALSHVGRQNCLFGFRFCGGGCSHATHTKTHQFTHGTNTHHQHTRRAICCFHLAPLAPTWRAVFDLFSPFLLSTWITRLFFSPSSVDGLSPNPEKKTAKKLGSLGVCRRVGHLGSSPFCFFPRKKKSRLHIYCFLRPTPNNTKQHHQHHQQHQEKKKRGNNVAGVWSIFFPGDALSEIRPARASLRPLCADGMPLWPKAHGAPFVCE